MSKRPIKRHKNIQPMSRDHHHGLLVGWKIRTGIRYGISSERIYKYLSWFYKNHLIDHFKEEETLLFPILDSDHPEIKRAMEEHVQIHDFFRQEEASEEELVAFEKLLTAHIRYEERVLFNSIQEKATESELKVLAIHLEDEPFVENTEDEFWISPDRKA